MIDRKDKRTPDLFGAENALAQAKRETMEKAKGKGDSCPCCGQFVKVYRRTINSTMARMLIKAWQCAGMDWFHISDIGLGGAAGGGDFSKLEYWRLITRDDHHPGDEGKRTSGMWKITALGRDFIEGRALVPHYALVYNGVLIELDGADTHIQHALGKKFDYRELMAPVGSVGRADAVG